jgi:putative tricarboxylic transport membrane protein
MKKIYAERIFSLFLMALAVSSYFQTMELRNQGGVTGLMTSPAFFPQWVAVLLFVCSGVPLVKTFFWATEESETMAFPPPQTIIRLFSFLAIIGAALLIIPFIGWLGAQFILVFVLEMLFEGRKWKHSLAVSLGGVAVIYIVFELALGIPLPRGFLE